MGSGSPVPAFATHQREATMNGWTLLAALLAGGVLIYLVAVLLQPEDFS